MPNIALKLVILGSPLKGALILFVKEFPRMCHSPEKVQSCKSSVLFHYLNIIFTQTFFDTGCQFGLFHLQQWGRGEISPNGSHSDWQPVSPGKPYSLCCKAHRWLGTQDLLCSIPHVTPFLACPLSYNWKVLTNIHGLFQVLPFSKKKKTILTTLVSLELMWQLLSFPLSHSYWLCSIHLGRLFKHHLCLPCLNNWILSLHM